MPRSVLSSSEIYPGSGTKLRPRQSLRTPQQHVPLKFDDRVKNRRASKSFVLLDQSDLDTPRARVRENCHCVTQKKKKGIRLQR